MISRNNDEKLVNPAAEERPGGGRLTSCCSRRAASGGLGLFLPPATRRRNQRIFCVLPQKEIAIMRLRPRARFIINASVHTHTQAGNTTHNTHTHRTPKVAGAGACSWPTSHPDSHVTFLGQHSFVTVPLIMLMRPRTRRRRRALAQIKGKRRRAVSPNP